RRAPAGRADVQFVMETRSLEIEVHGDYTFTKEREVACSIGQQKATTSSSLVGVESKSLHRSVDRERSPLINERPSDPADLLHADAGCHMGIAGGHRTLGMRQKLENVGPQSGIGLSFGAESLGELPCPVVLSSGQGRSHGPATCEGTLRGRGRKKLGDFLLEER